MAACLVFSTPPKLFGGKRKPKRPVQCQNLRVFVVSDLHTDYPENMTWVRNLSLSNQQHRKDVLVVAGDVAETRDNFVLTMSLLKDCFQRVLYVPGNHDLWCRQDYPSGCDSLDKLHMLLEECERIGVDTRPLIVDGLGIIPLLSWYHQSFDKEMDIDGFRIPPLDMACKDFHACKWPEGITNAENSLALFFDAMNDKNQDVIEEIKLKCRQIISFSHFVPRSVNFVAESIFSYVDGFDWIRIIQLCIERQELCPEKRMLFYPKLPKIIGSEFLESRIRWIHGDGGSAGACHVFGHTHFSWDAVVDGIRYVQAPLAYPRERKRRMNGGENWLPFCIYQDAKFARRLSPCYWSDYYHHNPRTPHITQLAPWVAAFYSKLPPQPGHLF